MMVAERHPRLIANLARGQERALAAWRADPAWPHRCRALDVLVAFDGALRLAHVDLPSGILTMEYMEPTVMRDAKRATSALRRLRAR